MRSAAQYEFQSEPPPAPGVAELYAYFNQYLGGRSSSAGIRVQITPAADSGSIAVGVDVHPEHRSAIVRGLEDAMAARFPGRLAHVNIDVVQVDCDEVSTSPNACYQAAWMVIDQAYRLQQPVRV